MPVTVHDAISGIEPGAWNRLAGNDYPFLKHQFLQAAEDSGSVSESSGWHPCHLTMSGSAGDLIGALLLYEKTHSWGEFVFDWAWANAYEQAGFDYYPKLVSAVPFTPASSTRILLRDPDDSETAAALIEAAISLAKKRHCSSVHFLFPDPADKLHLQSAGLKLRKDCQFHWRNRRYADFDEFLGTFSSAKRKKARRDRRHVVDAGIRFERLTGHQLDDETLQIVYRLISRTFMRRGSLPYFNFEFFTSLAQTLPDDVLVILASDAAGPVAASVFFVGADTLYGRYWGSAGHYNALHFETCYYQGIDYCIENGLTRFEPGTQGEHKVSRGFLPTETCSAHWLAHPEFFSAIGDYVDEEARHIERYMQAVDDHSPYRQREDSE